MKAISSGDYGGTKDRFEYQALRFACVVSASMFLISTENAWSQCVPAAGQLILNGGTCSETGAIRDRDALAVPAPVISVLNGGNYTGTSVSLSNATSHPGHGLSVDGAGSIARLYRSIVMTTGASYGYGIDVANGGTFEAEDLEVSTTGDDSDAITLNAGATATINGARLVTAGKTAEGIQANASSFTGSGVEVITLATDADATSNGVLLLNGSTGQLTNSSITTAGGYSAGLWATDSSSFTGAGLTIKTSGGPFGEGVLVNISSSVILDNSSVTTTGAEAIGVGVFGVGSSFGLKGGSITTSGTNSHAVSVANGATAILTGVNTSASGDGASAIHVNNTAGTDRGSVTVNGGSLSSAAGPLIWADAGHSEITLNGPVGISASLKRRVAPRPTPMRSI